MFMVTVAAFRFVTRNLIAISAGFLASRDRNSSIEKQDVFARNFDPPQEAVEKWLTEAAPEVRAEVAWIEGWTSERHVPAEARLIAKRVVFLFHQGSAEERESARQFFLKAGKALANAPILA
jgi:hypothetical protein